MLKYEEPELEIEWIWSQDIITLDSYGNEGETEFDWDDLFGDD